ncbi:hemolysin family protein [Paenibacillus sp. YIM B09110]|uniref:hemolysin family protein n=1 Tax=Paenibacillus sp. YIM B09110 TaxID=3126102 RepID=UPI00301B947D
MGIGFNLFMVAILIVLTAFFVATEFAIIRLRASRVDQLVVEGKKNALAVQKVKSNLDAYLSACQLGITITSLGLGWLGEPTVEKILFPLFDHFGLSSDISHVLSFLIAFIVVTFLHVVIGELAPKTLAIQKAEFVSFLTAKPIIYFYKLMFPFIWVLNGSANRLVRLFGLKPASEHEEAHSEEEIQIILNESYQSGKINNTEYGYVNRIFAFDELIANEIMVPRTDMICLYTSKSLQENMEIIRKEQFTRFPVAVEGKDNIIGMINTKQLYLSYQSEQEFDFTKLIQPVLSVSEVTPVKSLLERMQQERVHIAILVDEYGGTSGLVTIEDILEEIVGEIRDEFDSEERAEIEMVTDNRYLLDGKVSLDQLTSLLGIKFDDDSEVDTVGGWLYSQIPQIHVGKKYEYNQYQFIIKETSKNRIRKVELIILQNENVAASSSA